jgi:hypothetical protein
MRSWLAKVLAGIDMYEVKATSMWVAPETYVVNEQAEAEELAMELRAQQYIVEVSEIDVNWDDIVML